jgi:hypothetical protein
MDQNCVPAVVSNHDGIASLAFQLWENAGCPDGRDLEFWLLAKSGDRYHFDQVAAEVETPFRMLNVTTSAS